MMARDRRYRRGRPTVLKTRAGLVTAVLACGAIAAGAIAIAAATASGHSAAMAASPAAYSARSGGEGAVLNSALGNWSSSNQAATYSELGSLTQVQGYSQTRHQGRTLDIQRGIVVLATSNYLILKSASGSLHLWLLSGATKVQDVTGTTAGTMALTGSASVTQQEMSSGNMVPAASLLAGSPETAAAMLTPTAAPETESVQVAGTDLTVTVTVTRGTATVSQTATTPATGAPVPDQVTFTQNAWQTADSIARGDLAVVVGMRSHGTLHAQLILFTPLSTEVVGGGVVAGGHF